MVNSKFKSETLLSAEREYSKAYNLFQKTLLQNKKVIQSLRQEDNFHALLSQSSSVLSKVLIPEKSTQNSPNASRPGTRTQTAPTIPNSKEKKKTIIQIREKYQLYPRPKKNPLSYNGLEKIKSPSFQFSKTNGRKETSISSFRPKSCAVPKTIHTSMNNVDVLDKKARPKTCVNLLNKPRAERGDSKINKKKSDSFISVKKSETRTVLKDVLTKDVPEKPSPISVHNSKPYLPTPNPKKLEKQKKIKKLRKFCLEELMVKVFKAKQDRQTFTVQYGGAYLGIRKALLKKGWIEKLHNAGQSLNTELKDLCKKPINELIKMLPENADTDLGDLIEVAVKSKLLSGHQVDFYWGINYSSYKLNQDDIKLTLINSIRYVHPCFVNKRGLSVAAKNTNWADHPYGKYNLNHPRTYCLCKDGEVEDFFNDFKITSAISLVQWVLVRTEQEMNLSNAKDRIGIPLRTFDFAYKECAKFLRRISGKQTSGKEVDSLEAEWEHFLVHFYKIVHEGRLFKAENESTMKSIVQRARQIIQQLKNHCTHIDMDGFKNIWVVKPSASCEGEDIHLCKTLQDVLKVVQDNPQRLYIIQKYIEKPYLIYDTKFHIRQWFLISSVVPLQIWIYRDFYLRFGSKKYDLSNFEEAIHLTNNAIQSRYLYNSKDRSEKLPEFNLWHSGEFKAHLEERGQTEAYELICTGMKQSILAAVLRLHTNLDTRENSFELYGADFLICNDFVPWLLEINAKPGMPVTTPVADRMCFKMQQDLIKVIIDRKKNPHCSTGKFHPIYDETSEPKISKPKIPLQEEDNFFNRILVPATPKKYFNSEPLHVETNKFQNNPLKGVPDHMGGFYGGDVVNKSFLALVNQITTKYCISKSSDTFSKDSVAKNGADPKGGCIVEEEGPKITEITENVHNTQETTLNNELGKENEKEGPKKEQGGYKTKKGGAKRPKTPRNRLSAFKRRKNSLLNSEKASQQTECTLGGDEAQNKDWASQVESDVSQYELAPSGNESSAPQNQKVAQNDPFPIQDKQDLLLMQGDQKGGFLEGQPPKIEDHSPEIAKAIIGGLKSAPKYEPDADKISQSLDESTDSKWGSQISECIRTIDLNTSRATSTISFGKILKDQKSEKLIITKKHIDKAIQIKFDDLKVSNLSLQTFTNPNLTKVSQKTIDSENISSLSISPSVIVDNRAIIDDVSTSSITITRIIENYHKIVSRSEIKKPLSKEMEKSNNFNLESTFFAVAPQKNVRGTKSDGNISKKSTTLNGPNMTVSEAVIKSEDNIVAKYTNSDSSSSSIMSEDLLTNSKSYEKISKTISRNVGSYFCEYLKDEFFLDNIAKPFERMENGKSIDPDAHCNKFSKSIDCISGDCKVAEILGDENLNKVRPSYSGVHNFEKLKNVFMG